MQRVPGVKAVAVVNNLPLSGVNTTVMLELPGGEPIRVPTRTISPQYFSVMGIPLVAGRAFTESDVTGRVPWRSSTSISRRNVSGTRCGGPETAGGRNGNSGDVVGVVRNSPQMSYEAPPKEELYRPYRQVIFGVFLSTMVVRTSVDPVSLATALRKVV